MQKATHTHTHVHTGHVSVWMWSCVLEVPVCSTRLQSSMESHGCRMSPGNFQTLQMGGSHPDRFGQWRDKREFVGGLPAQGGGTGVCFVRRGQPRGEQAGVALVQEGDPVHSAGN